MDGMWPMLDTNWDNEISPSEVQAFKAMNGYTLLSFPNLIAPEGHTVGLSTTDDINMIFRACDANGNGGIS